MSEECKWHYFLHISARPLKRSHDSYFDSATAEIGRGEGLTRTRISQPYYNEYSTWNTDQQNKGWLILAGTMRRILTVLV